MRVLITGADGQVGRAALRGRPAMVKAIATTRLSLDITDEAGVHEMVRRCRPDLIVNAAAYTAVDRAESDSAAAWRVNADGPRFLALAARDAGARLFHLSTDFVFDGTSSTPYGPGAPTNPINEYGRTKLAGEVGVLEVLPERSVVLRTAWVYAAIGHNFLCTMLRVMKERKAVRVVADQIGTPTAAGSVADIIWRLAARPEITGVHHWTDAGVASWYDFAVAIAEEGALRGLLPSAVTVTPIKTEDYPTAARRPAYSVLDKSSLMSLLGYAPSHWREVLRTMLRETDNA